MTEKKEETEINLHQIVRNVSSNFVVYFVCLLALLACGVTIYLVEDFQDQCNGHWMQEIERLNCIPSVDQNSLPIIFNNSNVIPNVNIHGILGGRDE